MTEHEQFPAGNKISTENPKDAEIVSAISSRFRNLIRELLKGNIKRARELADIARNEIPCDGEHITFQNLIEEMAEGQAMRNSLINLPSAVPGIGTLISWMLISLEDFFVLDQSVTLILSLSLLHGLDPCDEAEMEKLAIGVIGEAYGIASRGPERDSSAFVKQFMIKLLPARYVNFGLTRWAKAFIKRLLPFRRKSRLLPAGFGILVSAWDAYDTLVKVGQIALRELSGKKHIKEFEG
ncbi:MAG TPA: hypothetical protein VMU10_02225 [Desulfomonilia bacterium]|nr:hypothetical protein [Desulfomonilia bacterium]